MDSEAHDLTGCLESRRNMGASEAAGDIGARYDRGPGRVC
jgi:hypothetical protein